MKGDNKKSGVAGREAWRSKWGFILACIGSAVGMGNIWLFPYRVATYGGAFLLAYLIFDLLLGFSGVIGEMSFGRASRTGPVGAFEQACASREKGRIGLLLGMIPMFGALALAIGYSVVVGWVLKYTVGTFTGQTLKPQDAAGFGTAFAETASSFGNNFWLILAVLGTFVIMVLGIAEGIEKANKILIPLFYMMFIGLAVYISTQPGAADGYKWMFTIDPEIFADPKMWVYALGQAFFSLSLAGNGTIIYGSYLKDEEDIVSAAWKVALFDTAAAMLAAMVIIPAMATTGAVLSESGPGLMFISLPYLFHQMPGGIFMAVIFFLAVLFAGLTSLVNLYEAPIATLQDQLKFSRRKAVAVIGGMGLLVSVCIQGIVSGWMDFVSIYICPLGAALAGIMFAWVWGREKIEAEVSKGRRKKIGSWYYPLYKYIFCGLTVAVFILGIVFGGIG